MGSHRFRHCRGWALWLARRGRRLCDGAGAPAIHQFDSTVSACNVSSRYCTGFNFRRCCKLGSWALTVGSCHSVFHWRISRHDLRALGRCQAVGAKLTKRVCHCICSGCSGLAGKSYSVDQGGGLIRLLTAALEAFSQSMTARSGRDGSSAGIYLGHPTDPLPGPLLQSWIEPTVK